MDFKQPTNLIDQLSYTACGTTPQQRREKLASWQACMVKGHGPWLPIAPNLDPTYSPSTKKTQPAYACSRCGYRHS